MGALLKALSRPSSYSDKRNGSPTWTNLVDRMDGAMVLSDLDDIEAWVEANRMSIPAAYDEHIAEELEKARERIASEDVGSILREKFDF